MILNSVKTKIRLMNKWKSINLSITNKFSRPFNIVDYQVISQMIKLGITRTSIIVDTIKKIK